MEQEVVQNYEWMDSQEFAEVLALGNALPGPIATKMAGFIGFEVGILHWSSFDDACPDLHHLMH